MRPLPASLRDELRPALSEASVQRIWHAIAEKRARTPKAATRPLTVRLVLAASLLLVVLLWRAPGLRPDVAPPAAGPLVLAGGAEIGFLEAPPAAPAHFDLSDGSRIVLSPGARLSALESTDRVFAALVSTGRIEFDVKKGGPRRWSIECGIATVEIIGTRLLIDRSATRVRVQVFEGVVLVRGERVPERVRRLPSGESVEVDDTRAETASTVTPHGPPADDPTRDRTTATEAPAGKGSKTATAARTSAGSWRELAQSGDHKGAYQALGTQGIRRESTRGGVEELLALADIARLSGHPADAAIPLSRIVRDHPGDPRAALSAFTLGRLELDVLAQPAQAAASFRSALDLGLSTPLVEDAQARMVEAYARSGNSAAARTASAEYQRLFPHGRRLDDVRRWVDSQ